jgi:HrpA-like RNA helicase
MQTSVSKMQELLMRAIYSTNTMLLSVCARHQGSNVLAIPGRQYPVSVFYTKAPEADYVDAAMLTCLQVRSRHIIWLMPAWFV